MFFLYVEIKIGWYPKFSTLSDYTVYQPNWLVWAHFGIVVSNMPSGWGKKPLVDTYRLNHTIKSTFIIIVVNVKIYLTRIKAATFMKLRLTGLK